MGYYCSCPCPLSFSRNVLTTPEPWWVKLCLLWQLASGLSLPMAGTCYAWPFQANRAWTQCSLAWIQLMFQWQMNIQGHFLFWLFCFLLYCHIWAYTDLPSYPCSCESVVPAWTTQLGKWTSRQQPVMAGFGQPSECSDSNHDIPRKSTLWQHPKGPSFSMG